MNVDTAPAIETAIQELQTRVRGRIVTPAEPDYESLRQIMYGAIEGHPAAIVRVLDATDVSRTVLIAAETGVPFTVRSGGHSGAGHSTIDGGIVIDVREMRSIQVDPANRTLWAETGATAAEVTAAAVEHGLAVGFGDTGSVGIAGITLGGGVGYLGRKFGLTIDNLVAAELVTADGQLHRVNAETNPDLFWAIRGGGGNFGVATRFQYQLHELPAAYGGFLTLPATVETITGFIAAAEAAPDELSTIANVMPAPPMPGVPEDVVGQPVIFGALLYAGSAEDGERTVAPFRALGQAVMDSLAAMPITGMYPPEDPDYHPKAASLTMFMHSVGTAEAETILRFLNSSDASIRVAQLRVLGGAIARVPADATAYGHRRSPIMVNVAAFWDGPDDRPEREAWVRDFAAALHQGNDGAYVNFLGDEGPQRVRAAYPGSTWDRLREIKARYDPRNLLDRNQNIPPA